MSHSPGFSHTRINYSFEPVWTNNWVRYMRLSLLTKAFKSVDPVEARFLLADFNAKFEKDGSLFVYAKQIAGMQAKLDHLIADLSKAEQQTVAEGTRKLALREIGRTDVVKTLKKMIPPDFATKVESLEYKPFLPDAGQDAYNLLASYKTHASSYFCKLKRKLQREVEAKSSVSSSVSPEFKEAEGKVLKRKHSAKALEGRPAYKTLAQKGAATIALLKGMCKHLKDDLGMSSAFLTMSLPSEYHPGANKDNQAWLDAGSPDPKFAAKVLTAKFNAFKAAVKRSSKGVPLAGFRVVEAHKDGCPHSHAILFANPDHMPAIEQAFFKYFPDAAANRFAKIEQTKGMMSSCTYMLKKLKHTSALLVTPEEDTEQAQMDREGNMMWSSLFELRSNAFFGIDGFRGLWDECFKAGQLLNDGKTIGKELRGVGLAADMGLNNMERMAHAAFHGDGLTFFRLHAESLGVLKRHTLRRKARKLVLAQDGTVEDVIEVLQPVCVAALEWDGDKVYTTEKGRLSVGRICKGVEDLVLSIQVVKGKHVLPLATPIELTGVEILKCINITRQVVERILLQKEAAALVSWNLKKSPGFYLPAGQPNMRHEYIKLIKLRISELANAAQGPGFSNLQCKFETMLDAA